VWYRSSIYVGPTCDGLGFYTAWLLPASIVGVLVFLYGVFTVGDDNYGYAVFFHRLSFGLYIFLGGGTSRFAILTTFYIYLPNLAQV